MGTHSDGYVEQELLTTFVTCEGDLSDPQFNTKFARLLKQLQKLLLKDPGQYLGVVKVEPWNSVRVTFTVPKEAALRLRQLAQQGDATLSQLGILSVQLEGDQAISLRIAGRVGGESREIVLRTSPADNDDDGGGESSISTGDAERLISKSAVVSTCGGGTASLFRTMTQVLSGTGGVSPAAFRSPSTVGNTFRISSPSPASPAVISTNASKPSGSLPHSYHSAFVTTTTAPPTPNRDSSSIVDSSSSNSLNHGNNNGGVVRSHRFSLPPPPPYPNAIAAKTATKTNRTSGEDGLSSTNPSPANVALSSPLLVNLLQNDGVPINNSKIAASDKHRLKQLQLQLQQQQQQSPTHIKNAVPSNTAKRKDSTTDATASEVAGGEMQQQVIQRIQRAPTTSTTDNLTMVTNVRIPVESCNTSDVATVASAKLPNMNHLTTVTTANVKQTYTSQPAFQQRVNQPATAKPPAAALINNQLANRITYGHNDNQLLAAAVGQAHKLGVRVINVQQQQQLFQSQQQLLQKQLAQQQHILQSQQYQQQQQLAMQSQQQQHLMQPQKSVILQQNLQHGAKVNVTSVQELARFNASVVASRIVAQQQQQQQLQAHHNEVVLGSQQPQGLNDNATSSGDTTSMADDGDKSIGNYIPMSSMITEAAGSRGDATTTSTTSMNNAIVTCASLQFVKSFTFTNPSSVMVSNTVSMAGSLQQPAKPKLNSMLYNTETPSSPDTKTSAATSLYGNTSNSYHNVAVVTNTNTAVTGDNGYETSTTCGAGLTQLPPQYSRTSEPVDDDTKTTTTTPSAPPAPHSTSAGTDREPQFLINPLTGEMEAMPTESSDNESDQQTDIFNSLPPSVTNNEDSCFSFSSPVNANEKSNSMYSDDDDEPETDVRHRNSPSAASDIECPPSTKTNGGDSSTFPRHRILSAGCSANTGAGEKIKIRLKLEKNEPVANAYKVDVLNSGVKKLDKPTSIVKPMPRVLSSSVSSSATNAQNTTPDEPRVPPIRLSLRGKNLAFVKKQKKWSDDKDTADDTVNEKKSYFKNKLSPNDVISDKECLTPDTIDLCKSPAMAAAPKTCIEDADDLVKVKVTKTKKSAPELEDALSPSDNTIGSASELNSPYNVILPSVRTFPTEAEVTSILRSVPTDAPNKMSLSCVKIKKKEGKKKLFPRDRTSALSGSVLGDDSTDTFTRVLNETKCTLSSQSSTRGKSKSNASSLLKSVMKSTAAKEARLMNLANRNLEKRLTTQQTAGGNMTEGAGTTVVITSKANALAVVPTSVHQRRSSADMSYTAAAATFSNTKISQRSSADSFAHSAAQFVPSANNVFATSTQMKEGKKFVNNAIGGGGGAAKKIANNCKARDYQNAKAPEMRKEFLANHENKKNNNSNSNNPGGASGNGHFGKKNVLEAIECGVKQNVVVNCLHVESNPTLSNLPTTHLDLSEKALKQRLLEDTSSTFGEPTRKKARLDGAPAELLKNGPMLERLTTLPKENEVAMGAGNESPSGATSEHTNNQGEDSGIESMDALSEKSPNQSESPCRKEEKDCVVAAMTDAANAAAAGQRDKKSSASAYCDKPNVADNFSDSSSNTSASGGAARSETGDKGSADSDISNVSVTSSANSKMLNNCLETSSSSTDNSSAAQDKDESSKSYDRDETLSPDLDDVQPFRVTPALYTYSNPEKMRVDSPSPVLEDITDDISLSPKPVIVEQPKTSTRLKRKRKEVSDPMFVGAEKNKNSPGGKSLLEQLLIDIPSDSNVEIRRTGMSTRNTRSQLKGLSQPSPDTLSMCSTSSSSSIKTPKCSPIPRADETPNKSSPRPSSRLTSRRSRKGSESSNVSNGDESASYGRMSKRKCSENVGCIGFEDQNGKKVAVSTTSIEAFRSINDGNVNATPTVVVSSTRTGVGRGGSHATAGRRMNNNAVSDNVTPNTNATRLMGKKRRGMGDMATTNVGRKSNYGKTQDNCNASLIQVAGSEHEENVTEQSVNVTSTTPRTNSRLSSVNSSVTKQTPSTPSTSSRRSVRQNHVTRRRNSPTVVDGKMNAANSLVNSNTGGGNNNNNNTNKNNNNTKANAGEAACKSANNEKNGVGVNMDSNKIENKSISKLNCVTKKEIVSQITTNATTNSIIDTKSNNGTNFAPNAATVTTRGNSVKQSHLINDSAIAAPPQDISHTHTVPVSEEVINTRRKTRSVANSNVSDELANKRRRNSRDGK